MTPRSTQLSKQTDSGYPSYLDVIPRMGTLRNFANPTYGTRMGMVARLLGQPFMPWQQYVADVIGEVDPRTGIRIYREAYLTTMRQVGKTTFVIVTKAHTALDTPVPVRTLFAAQEGKSAIGKMVEHAELVRRTPLGRKLAPGTPVTSNGKEHVAWSNGSTEWPLSEKESSGHGSTIALGAITEAMAHRDDRYITTMQPAMNVNPNALLLVESTQGNAKSLYWNEQTTELEERWSADPAELTNARTAFFNFSFGPDDDLGSPDTWRHRIPSIGHTLRLEEVEHAWLNATTPKKLRAFKRNFGNIADLGAGDDTVLTDEQWEASASDAIIVGRRAFTLDITNDGSWATIAWGGMNTDNRVQAEVVKHERSMHWVLPYFGQLFELNPRAPRRVYVVAGSRAAAMAERFSAADIEMIVLPRSEYAAAVTDWFDGITDDSGPTTVHARNNQSPLDIAVGGASWTKSKPPVWDDGLSRTIISPLVATSIAPWAFQLELKRAEEIEDLLETVA